MASSTVEKDYEMGATLEEKAQMLDVELEKERSEDLLPSPVQAQQPTANKPKLSASAIIPVWIVLSSSVIIYNNYLYNTLEFRFPVFLVTWHLTFAVSAPFPRCPYPSLPRLSSCRVMMRAWWPYPRAAHIR